MSHESGRFYTSGRQACALFVSPKFVFFFLFFIIFDVVTLANWTVWIFCSSNCKQKNNKKINYSRLSNSEKEFSFGNTF